MGYVNFLLWAQKVSRNKITELRAGKPANYYGLSKLACEHIIENSLRYAKKIFLEVS